MRYPLLFIGITLIASSCFDAPQFPNTPKITFKNILFKDLNSGPDSLNLFIDFEDGDGDLGLDPSEIADPYNQKHYFSNKTGSKFNFVTETSEDLMVLSNRTDIDSLPPFSGDAKCFNWDTNPELFFEDGSQLVDTVYFQFNKRFNNIYVTYLVDRGSGFQVFDWRKEVDCSTNYDGRFPLLNEDGKKRALEGTIKYGMVSVGFKSLFKDDLMKLRITILDRSGNYSNTVETPPFRLSEID